MTKKLFSELNLSPEVLKAIEKLGFEQASPIQAEAIPVLLEGRDVVGQSQTGSGKTAAFAVPAIEKTDPNLRMVQVLILCPTRELAVQVAEEFHKLALFKKGLHALPIYGGQSYERQFAGLRAGTQIVIGTPGRIMDHLRRGTLRLDNIRMAVLDEADVMLDMGFRDDIEIILQATPKERQTVFFSATMPRAIQELIQKYSRDPKTVKIEQKELTVPTVDQVYYEVDRRFKLELLTRLIDLHDLRLGIIFCNTKRMVDDLVDHLSTQGYSADRLHGDMTQTMRDRVMNKFRKSGLEFLVATDVAARGIDVENIQVVFNYDLPYDVEDYLHRIGRTGRAGRSGMAISFAAGRELFQIHQIERFIRVKMRRGKPPTAGEVEEARTGVFLDKLRATLKSGEYKRQDHFIERLLEEGFTSTDIASALIHQLQSSEAAPVKLESREELREPRQSWDEGRGQREEWVARKEFAAAGRRPKFGRPTAELAAPRREVPEPRKPRFPTAGALKAPEVQKPKDVPPATAKPVQSTAPLPGKFTESRPPGAEQAVPPAKPSRRTPGDQARLYINIGNEMGVSTADVLNTILGETGLPARVVGRVDLRERHTFVDVAGEHAAAIISKLNRTRIRDQKIKVKLA